MNTPTVITIGILAAIFVVVFIVFIKRFTSKQTCCGTEKVKFQKKRLKNVAGKVIFHVEGMHCNNCKASVEKAVNDFEGLSGKVNLENKTLTVSYQQDAKVEEDKIISVLGELGFSASRKL